MTELELVELAIRRIVDRIDFKEGYKTEAELRIRDALHDIADEMMKISAERAKVSKSGGWYAGSGD